MPLFPDAGLSAGAIRDALAAFKEGDVDWRRGRAPMYVFWPGAEAYEVTKDAFVSYFSENALGTRAFPSLVRLEQEVVAMAAEILGGGPDAAGSLTSGGSESIFLAIKTARDHARAGGRLAGQGRLVLPSTAHPAFNKAAHVMDIEVARVPVRADFRADVGAMADAVDDRTIMIVGSAPSFSHGVMDPIEDLGRLALERGLWLHVDACVGGYVAPFARMAGYPVPPFELSVPGVSSISADLHKLGFAAKPASTVLYRSAELYAHQRYRFTDWPRGAYDTPNLTGTRPGGAVAAAWATLKFLGRDGYVDLARQIMGIRADLEAGIREIPHLELIGDPELALFLFGSREIDINAVADKLEEKGWLVGRNADPPAIHFFLTPIHRQMVDDYLADLRAAVGTVTQQGLVAATVEATY